MILLITYSRPSLDKHQQHVVDLFFFSLYIAKTSDYFYGDASLFAGRNKRGFRVRTWRFRHSLLLFRGVIFEWGIKRSHYMKRPLTSCNVKWRRNKRGKSRCLLSDVKKWTRAYHRRYGRYRLFRNNSHHFVNRLSKYLDKNCGRWFSKGISQKWAQALDFGTHLRTWYIYDSLACC